MGKLKLYPEMIKDGSDGYLKVRDGFLSAEVVKTLAYIRWESKQNRSIRESIDWDYKNDRLPMSFVQDGSRVESGSHAGSYALVCKKPRNLMKYRTEFKGINNEVLDKMLKIYDAGNILCGGCGKPMSNHLGRK